MAAPQPPYPVKYFIAVLFREEQFLHKASVLFLEEWGEADFEGKDHPFTVTDYYEKELGADLKRRLISFKRLLEPTQLVPMKLACNAIEEHLSTQGNRRVNCDVGFLDHNKIVLASAKEAGQKIYLDRGIYADLAGRYKNGRYQPFEWSFPDFKDGRYDEELVTMRSLYLMQMKALRDKSRPQEKNSSFGVTNYP
jgi:hypothetical protein